MFSSPTYLCEFTEHVLYSMNQNTFYQDYDTAVKLNVNELL